MRAHRSLGAMEHHGGARSRTAALDMCAKPAGFFVSPRAMTRSKRHGGHLCKVKTEWLQ
jgi:hypothetical protein